MRIVQTQENKLRNVSFVWNTISPVIESQSKYVFNLSAIRSKLYFHCNKETI